ncbi:unnamed protein product [Fusarium venenatum]|uniref:Uncharacterized protein n=1 Tax=Fusarium venenatum TaxID=56646 RepID=A0A2L2TL56_9HYPO|nr:uncharacterized protein FVRRES_10916 [Fusarium venenatum]CEI70839.1 unnamed protein product [Fusarium venenatum]
MYTRGAVIDCRLAFWPLDAPDARGGTCVRLMTSSLKGGNTLLLRLFIRAERVGWMISVELPSATVRNPEKKTVDNLNENKRPDGPGQYQRIDTPSLFSSVFSSFSLPATGQSVSKL